MKEVWSRGDGCYIVGMDNGESHVYVPNVSSYNSPDRLKIVLPDTLINLIKVAGITEIRITNAQTFTDRDLEAERQYQNIEVSST